MTKPLDCISGGLLRLMPVAVGVLFLLTGKSAQGLGRAEEPEVVTLTALEVAADRPERSEQLHPLGRGGLDLFGSQRGLLEIPRALTEVSPEAMRLFGIEDFNDLSQVGAGTQRINYFGIAGTPFVRGAKAGVYLNGMLRAYQRNEMPVSFGSLESLTIVKGASPAHLSPTLVGGYVNFQPKSPYYGAPGGSVQVTLGSWNQWRGQVDAGGAFTIGAHPAAFRLSLTGQRSDRYYEDIKNDFVSLYGAVKVRLTSRLTLSAGGEFYAYSSGEAPGWNRPTQQLIDEGRYVIGEPAEILSEDWGGNANRLLTEWPNNQVVPGLTALAVPGDLVRERIPEDLRGLMLDLNTESGRQEAYRVLSREEASERGIFLPSWFDPASVEAEIARLSIRPQDAFVYTPAYLEAGGEVLTTNLSRDRLLADPDDRADSRNYLGFMDFDLRGTDRSLINQTFVEGLETDKLSTYGFAIETRQVVLANKTTASMPFPGLDGSLQMGLELRHQYALMRQDFFAEPFSRRDLSREEISPNTVIAAGAQLDPEGNNLWSLAVGANQEHWLYQAGLFAVGDVSLGERLSIIVSGRLEHAHYNVKLPDGIDRATERDRQRIANKGHYDYWIASINPTFRLADGLFLYGVLQQGTALGPGDGGTISGRESFTDVELYEVGLKAGLWDNRLYSSLSLYRWDQSTFSTRDARAFPLRGEGIEWESSFSPSARWDFTATATAQRVTLQTEELGFGAFAFGEADWGLFGGVLNAGDDRSTPNNPENIFGGFPELSASLHARWRPGGGIFVAGGPLWRGAFWANHDRTLRIPDSLTWNFQLGWGNERWRVTLLVENAFDEESFQASDPVFSSNTLVVPGEPRALRLTLRREF